MGKRRVKVAPDVIGIDRLDDTSLAKIFRRFTPRERVSQISLVCKAWQRVEKANPRRPARLEFEPQHFRVRDAPAFARWQLRDASRLREVSIGSLNMNVLYTLLECLRDSAPALGSLTIVPDHSWYREETHPLALIGELGQLTHLHLKEWECTSREDTNSLSELCELTGLKALELSEVSVLGESLKYSVMEYGQHEKLANRTIQAAGTCFQDAIAALPGLTSLKLVDVEVMECAAIKCSWPCLRSLTFTQRHGYYGSPKAKRFPDLAAMPALEHLHIDLNEGEPPLSKLAGLRNLSELTVGWLPSYGTVKLAISPAAKLAKLTLKDCQSTAIESLLPLRTLQNVCDLTLSSYNPKAEPEWPTAWGKLKGLTRLVIFGNDRIAGKEASQQQKYLKFLSGLSGLRVLETSADCGAVLASGGKFLLSLACCVPSLMELVVILGGQAFLMDRKPVKGASSDLPEYLRYGPLMNTYKPSKELAQVCNAIVKKVPGSWISKACDREMESFSGCPGCVVFTFDK